MTDISTLQCRGMVRRRSIYTFSTMIIHIGNKLFSTASEQIAPKPFT